MKVVHSVPSLGESGGGPPRSVSQLCNELCLSKEAEIEIITAVDAFDPIVPVNPEITLVDTDSKEDSFLGNVKAADFAVGFQRICQDSLISVIHQHGIWSRSSHTTTRYAHLNDIPLVVAPRGMLEPWALNHSKWKKKVAWMLYQKYDLGRSTAFHATAASEAESIRRLGFKQPIAVIPNGVVLPDISVGYTSFHIPISELAKGKPRIALFLSRIHPKKGLPMLLDAWKKLSPEGWRLVIAGNDDGGHVAELQAQIERLELSDVVSYAGPLFGEAKEQAYLNASLFVLPSYSENFGIVVAEALGYGVPVLTTTGCPWQELTTQGCGWWVDPTPKAIEEGLKSALSTSNQELRAMGLRGRQLVEDQYQWPNIAKNMIVFYDWLLNGGKQPDFVI